MVECEGGGLSTAQGQGGYLGIVSSGAEQDLSKPMGMELSCLCKQVKGELPSSHFPNIPHFSYLHYSTVCFSSRAASVQTEAVPKFCVRRDKAAAKCGTRVCLLGSPWATALPGLGDVQTHPECPGAAQARVQRSLRVNIPFLISLHRPIAASNEHTVCKGGKEKKMLFSDPELLRSFPSSSVMKRTVFLRA